VAEGNRQKRQRVFRVSPAFIGVPLPFQVSARVVEKKEEEV
jgi:hypothetical protein